MDRGRQQAAVGAALHVLVFVTALWLVLVRKLGPGWALVPGDLADGRLNNFLLEHVWRWLSGLEPSLWDAPFFHPFARTFAFGDAFLGSAAPYALLRAAGLDREASFQGWYVVGLALDYAAVAWVLSRSGFRALGAGAGALLFAFGLPFLSQQSHVQLLYRPGVPLACHALLRLAREPRLRHVVSATAWLVWQLLASFYVGFFLALLMALLACLAPLDAGARSVRDAAALWPRRLGEAWTRARPGSRLGAALALAVAWAALAAWAWVYWDTARRYGLGRTWDEVQRFGLRDLFSSDDALLWRWLLGGTEGARNVEVQLFPGMAASAAVLIGVAFRFRTPNARSAWLHLAAAALALLLTIDLGGGLSVYPLLWSLPGGDAIRCTGRVMMVLLWPLAVFLAWVLDALATPLRASPAAAVAGALVALLVAESAAFDVATYPKAAAAARLAAVRARVPSGLPAGAVLAFAVHDGEHFILQEVDGMIVAQDLGRRTLSGYAGNAPPGYEPTFSCDAIPRRVLTYLAGAGNGSGRAYLEQMAAIVPIGFPDCDPRWWLPMPGLVAPASRAP
jgi:hypothetical protein